MVGGFIFLTLVSIVFFLYLFGRTAFRYYLDRKLCSTYAFKMTAISYLLLAPSAYCVQYTTIRKSNFDSELGWYAGLTEISDERETLDSKILSDVFVLVREATKTVCQEQCRCAGNPHLFDDDDSL